MGSYHWSALVFLTLLIVIRILFPKVLNDFPNGPHSLKGNHPEKSSRKKPCFVLSAVITILFQKYLPVKYLMNSLMDPTCHSLQSKDLATINDQQFIKATNEATILVIPNS